MAKELKNKTVAITGGAVGIGFEIADRFLQKGAKTIIILDINEKQGAEAVKTLNSKHGNNKTVFIKCDVTSDLEAVSKNIFDLYKHVDVLVNNAGVLNELAPRKTIEINVTALIEWSFKFWNHMRKDQGGNGGTIINLASIYGFRVDPYLPAYQASKFAVQGFTKSLGHAYNFKRSGVRVVAVNPGFTETALTEAPKGFDKDRQYMSDLSKFLQEQAWQQVASVGQAAVDVFERAESGTAWLIEGGRPIVEVK
ncbi:15-hydroxyprostaglandin dehydrogenase [NAD(+)]-like [Leguminivora glycinivorella]|uniref:15-hydroxyprostaglandin dehydrogenase [NAD(+)]-like n=1 Tax=Leguminivora glycinivorella TaxID=1035111 RepID=UPI00200E9B03|nr:15-hydroxyprostaglandin dehydrogenase [NAD(+)]-like [Leguminivora glycinivorella]